MDLEIFMRRKGGFGEGVAPAHCCLVLVLGAQVLGACKEGRVGLVLGCATSSF